jgi:hypothetical protein
MAAGLLLAAAWAGVFASASPSSPSSPRCHTNPGVAVKVLPRAGSTDAEVDAAVVTAGADAEPAPWWIDNRAASDRLSCSAPAPGDSSSSTEPAKPYLGYAEVATAMQQRRLQTTTCVIPSAQNGAWSGEWLRRERA